MAGWKIIQIDPRVLRQERENTRYTQLELAERSNITQASYCNIEKTWRLYEHNLTRILKVLNMPIKRGEFVTSRITNLTIKDLEIWIENNY